MAVSGTTTFSVTRDEVIISALQDLSVLEEGDVPTPAAVTKAAISLNLILKNLQAYGIKLWTWSNLTIPYVADKNTYTIGPNGAYDVDSNKPLVVSQGWIRNIQVSPPIDIPMQKLSRQEYNILGSKFSTGTTNSFFYTPYDVYGEVSVFLTPDASTVTNYELILTVRREIMDITTADQNFDLPSEWFLPLKWALMAELASSYGKTLEERMYYDNKAKYFLDGVEGFDVEDGSVYFVPDVRMQTPRYRQ